MKLKAVMLALLCTALVWSCGSEKEVKQQTADAPQEQKGPPVGTWLLYAGSDTGQRTENMDEEMTILVLEDSTYTLTFMQPNKQLNVVEKGSVSYNLNSLTMDFVVFSSTGVDFSGAEPRKLVDLNQVVPWERPPGTVYNMIWHTEMQHDESADVDREIMKLEAMDHEDSFFVRLENRDASAPTLDAMLKKN